jgi:YtcA family
MSAPLRRFADLVAALLVSGCSTSPSLNILGSFFPAWMLCAVAGILAAVVLRLALLALGINRYLIAPPLTYLSIAVAGTLLVWLLWFGH